ncbi:CAP domain-containing protein [Mesorhizobium sp. BAC0120]|uniref:CAP domain-containing protein n=1 Tax=Mesorhizobium sp. BAC0120 TaxID=3090670 RepID=UPI00298CE293|nr:CAP domain-containing protein [Mesorhizobium sp. BAC0120]MDW6024944.1 CAP domain-containing protein [Mesorhizobium sp. BAC0120]
MTGQTVQNQGATRTRPALAAPIAALLVSLIGLSACGTLGPGVVTESGGVTRSALGYMNQARQANGVAPAAPDARLEQAALEQARYMASAGRMTHTTRLGRDFVSRKNANRIDGAAAENVAVDYGNPDIGRIMKMWMASPGHRRNMLNPAYSHFGVASAADDKGRHYWAMVLAK